MHTNVYLTNVIENGEKNENEMNEIRLCIYFDFGCP